MWAKGRNRSLGGGEEFFDILTYKVEAPSTIHNVEYMSVEVFVCTRANVMVLLLRAMINFPLRCQMMVHVRDQRLIFSVALALITGRPSVIGIVNDKFSELRATYIEV